MKWSDITIKKYLQIMEIVAPTEWEENLKALAIVNDLTYEELRKRDLGELNKMIQEFAALNFQDIPTDEKPEWKEYKITTKLKNITVGQMVSFDEIKDTEGIGGLHKLISILTNPKDVEEYERRAELFYNEMPMTIAYSCMVFFCKVQKAFESYTQTYSKGERAKRWTLLQSITAGRQSFSNYVKGLFRRKKS